jgi:hypothetical protein
VLASYVGTMISGDFFSTEPRRLVFNKLFFLRGRIHFVDGAGSLLGFFARPLGSVVFSRYSDRTGKTMLVTT